MNNKDNYDELSSEYYSELHITSRNFDSSTLEYFKRNPINLYSGGIYLELGAGKGRVKEFCQFPSDRIISSDISYKMLSLFSRYSNFSKIQCDALKISFRDSIFSGIFAFLFDPFNLPEFYKEVHRVLKKEGFFIGTLPHYIWGITLRETLNINFSTTLFKKITSPYNEYISTTSYLMNFKEVYNIMHQSGFKNIVIKNLYLPNKINKISEHILIVAKKLGQTVYSIPLVLLIKGEKS